MPKEGVRVDKWLWSIRIFKSRTISTAACKTGKVRVGESIVKPSAMVNIDDLVEVKKNGFAFQFKVLKLIGKRVGAPLARECYLDLTPPEELNKYNSWFIGKSKSEFRDKGLGRPTKKERRAIDGFKTDYFEYDWDDDE